MQEKGSSGMKDMISAILLFFFARDKQEHPMPAVKTEKMFRKIQDTMDRKEEKNHD